MVFLKWDFKSILTLIIVVPWVGAEVYSSILQGTVTTGLAQSALMVIAFFYGAKSKSKDDSSGGDKNGTN